MKIDKASKKGKKEKVKDAKMT